MQETIWMNRTTSYYWGRPAAGIVRVEIEVAEQLKMLYPNSVYKECIWLNDRFEELTVELKYDCIKAEDDKNIFKVLSRNQAINNIVQGLFSLLPKIMRPIANKALLFLKPKYKYLYESYLNRKSIIPTNSLDNMDNKIQAIFKAGDIFISIGSDRNWEYFYQFYQMRTKYGIKVITCCHDLIPVLYPQYCNTESTNYRAMYVSYFMELAHGSDYIFCDSVNTRNDLNTFLENNGARKVNTTVFSLGDNFLSAEMPISVQISEILSKKYIIYVSTIERRKNHEVLYRAYHRLCQQGLKKDLPTLIFVGMQGWGVSNLMKDIELDPLTEGLIINLNHVNDSELKKLYENALFSLYPSLYEGWGLPIAESLSLGKIVLCSNQGSIPEVAGDLGIYLDPWDVESWANEIYSLIIDDKKRHDLEKKIREHYQRRTWQQSGLEFKKVIDAYRKSSIQKL